MWLWIINLWLSNTTWHHEPLQQLIGSCLEAYFAEEKASLMTALKFSGPFQKNSFPMQWVMLDTYQGPMGSRHRCNPTQIKQSAYAKENTGVWGAERARAFLMRSKAEGSSITQRTRGWSLQPTIPTAIMGCLHIRGGCWKGLPR